MNPFEIFVEFSQKKKKTQSKVYWKRLREKFKSRTKKEQKKEQNGKVNRLFFKFAESAFSELL